MKKLIVSLMAGSALVLGAAGTAAAQEAEPTVTVSNDQVEPNGEVQINVEGAEAGAAIAAALGEGTAEGTADDAGAATVAVNVGNVEVGQLDGIVTINGVEVPVSVAVVAAGGGDGGEGGEGGEAGGDGTPAPTAVNTGDGLSSSSSSATLFAAAAGLFLLGGSALVVRRQSADRR